MAYEQTNPTFGTNDFHRPKFLSKKESYVVDVLMILFGKPGFYPSMPSLGMNIQRLLYMFEDDINTESLKIELEDQCSEFADEIDSGNLDIVTVTHKGRLMLIFILPIINDTNEIQLSLGVTTNAKGEIIYNFVENKSQII